jgi:hypothetical protein
MLSMDTGISSQAETAKLCSRCGVMQPISQFGTKKGRKEQRLYHRSWCRECERVYARSRNQDYYQRNKEKIKADVATWYRANKASYRAWQKDYTRRKHLELKRAALAVYGEQCACCGEATFEFLTIDHVNNDGHIHRSEIKNWNFYEWLRKAGYQTEFQLQTLCFNCNFAKRYNGGTCPHKRL